MPFFFSYDGKGSTELLQKWSFSQEESKLDSLTRQRTQIWADPATGLQVRCVSIEYSDYAALEWTVYLRNNGDRDTPLLENVQAIDTLWGATAGGDVVLHGIKGDFCTADSYEPYELKLAPGVSKTFGPPGYSGKSCDGPDGWPYYNLQLGKTGGVIMAIGWPGQWAASFGRDSEQGVRIRAGQQLTRLVLHPGEEVRTPLIALLFWEGNDLVRAQNLWRRWYMKHNSPRTGGQPPKPIWQIQVGGAVAEIPGIEGYFKAGIRPNLCWRDAGGGHTWYPSAGGPYQGNDTWLNTGTWEVDRVKYPNGFRQFSDWVRSKGMHFLLWFEPERVGDPNSWLAKNHPEWLLPGSSHGSILNLGNPEALTWLVNHVDGMIKNHGLDWYREDMNGGGPLPAWRTADASDRQGITENLYVQGHIKFWDELRRRNPGLRIDSCASGGRRNDLETMRRAVPLLRSDFQFPDMKHVIEGNQGHTYGLSRWLPFQGTGCYLLEPYAFRSFYLPSFGMAGLSDHTLAANKQAYAECVRLAPLMLADFYPLTPYSLQADKWIGWQFNRPESGDGAVQVFRRSECSSSALSIQFQALDPKSRYRIENPDSFEAELAEGKDLMAKGYLLQITNRPGAAILFYSRVAGSGD